MPCSLLVGVTKALGFGVEDGAGWTRHLHKLAVDTLVIVLCVTRERGVSCAWLCGFVFIFNFVINTRNILRVFACLLCKVEHSSWSTVLRHRKPVYACVILVAIVSVNEEEPALLITLVFWWSHTGLVTNRSHLCTCVMLGVPVGCIPRTFLWDQFVMITLQVHGTIGLVRIIRPSLTDRSMASFQTFTGTFVFSFALWLPSSSRRTSLDVSFAILTVYKVEARLAMGMYAMLFHFTYSAWTKILITRPGV